MIFPSWINLIIQAFRFIVFGICLIQCIRKLIIVYGLKDTPVKKTRLFSWALYTLLTQIQFILCFFPWTTGNLGLTKARAYTEYLVVLSYFFIIIFNISIVNQMKVTFMDFYRETEKMRKERESLNIKYPRLLVRHLVYPYLCSLIVAIYWASWSYAILLNYGIWGMSEKKRGLRIGYPIKMFIRETILDSFDMKFVGVAKCTQLAFSLIVIGFQFFFMKKILKYLNEHVQNASLTRKLSADWKNFLITNAVISVVMIVDCSINVWEHVLAEKMGMKDKKFYGQGDIKEVAKAYNEGKTRVLWSDIVMKLVIMPVMFLNLAFKAPGRHTNDK